jgi:hypothetical protein
VRPIHSAAPSRASCTRCPASKCSGNCAYRRPGVSVDQTTHSTHSTHRTHAYQEGDEGGRVFGLVAEEGRAELVARPHALPGRHDARRNPGRQRSYAEKNVQRRPQRSWGVVGGPGPRPNSGGGWAAPCGGGRRDKVEEDVEEVERRDEVDDEGAASWLTRAGRTRRPATAQPTRSSWRTTRPKARSVLSSMGRSGGLSSDAYSLHNLVMLPSSSPKANARRKMKMRGWDELR